MNSFSWILTLQRTGCAEKYNDIPAQLESKLLQFQRDGVRYYLRPTSLRVYLFICGLINFSMLIWCLSMVWHTMLKKRDLVAGNQRSPYKICIKTFSLPFWSLRVNDHVDMHSRFALQRGCRVLIADEMGLGKTLQVIVATKITLAIPFLGHFRIIHFAVGRITLKCWLEVILFLTCNARCGECFNQDDVLQLFLFTRL